MNRAYASFREFYPFYLGEHANRTSRRLHFIGSCGVLVLLVAAIVQRDPRWLLAALACGYGFAWVGHFFFEKNRPATFRHPVYSAPQLKGMQEVITLVVFAVFSASYLGQALKWNHWAGFALIAVAAWLIFLE